MTCDRIVEAELHDGALAAVGPCCFCMGSYFIVRTHYGSYTGLREHGRESYCEEPRSSFCSRKK